VEAAKIGAEQRDLASKRKSMIDIFKNWGDMDDVSRESARTWADEMGTPIPEEAEEAGFDWKGWVDTIKGKWNKWTGGGKKGGAPTSDPLGLY
jgi:hypothetical protein